MKLSYEDKIEIIRLHEKGVSYPKLSKQFNVGKSAIYTCCRLFRQYGEEIFKRNKFNLSYSPNEKLEIIKRYYAGEAKSSLSVEYKIQRSMLFKWLRAYEQFGYNGLITKKRGRKKMKHERDEESKTINAQLSSPLTDEERKEFIQLKEDYKKLKKKNELSEMENEFLKKLDALVQERLTREKRK